MLIYANIKHLALIIEIIFIVSGIYFFIGGTLRNSSQNIVHIYKYMYAKI